MQTANYLDHGLIVPEPRATGKNVQLMLTCLCDAFFADVGQASVEVLEHLGCEVAFPEGQTCCGQPAFNAGDWKASRKVVRHTAKVFAGTEPVVVPSGSCAAMVFHGAGLAFAEEEDCAEIEALGRRTWEICDFIVNALGVTSWPGKFPARIAFHQSCHSRGTLSGPAAVQLLQSIEGVEIVPFDEPEQCCGFGGAFSVSFPNVSRRMGETKVGHLRKVQPDYLVSGDMGCMLHLGGVIDHAGESPALPRRHVVQIPRDALREA
jgi:L-lactate dehydrogenase complex protein LldE